MLSFINYFVIISLMEICNRLRLIDWRVSGRENLPPRPQGIVLACNHVQWHDIPMIGWGLPLSHRGWWFAKVEVVDGKVQVTREIDGGLEVLSLSMPAVITTDLRLNEPRYVTLPNIMKAKKKQLDNFKPEDLGVDIAPRITTLKVSEPPKRSAGIKVPDVTTLVDKLKNVSKVI